MAESPPVISVQQLLIQVCDGLGHGNRTLWETSASPVGALAVKSAELTVSFEMSSRGVEQEQKMDVPPPFPLLGAKTFKFFDAHTEARESNRATLRLEIVSVAPPPAAPPPDVPTVPGIKTPGVPKASQLATNIQAVIAAIDATGGRSDETQAHLQALRTIEKLALEGRDADALAALLALAARSMPPDSSDIP